MVHLDADRLAFLESKAKWVWEQTLKIHLGAAETRVASSLSAIEIFTTLYYGGFLKQNPQNPLDPERDRCIISKGHGSICMYPILADLGFFPMSELAQVCKEGSFLGGIPDPVIPGYETVNGSLGHGAGVSAGIATALKRRGKDNKVFVILGDGELHEGANWEAFMFAGHHGLDNLTAIVDDNKVCMLGHTVDVVSHRSLAEKFRAFGWDCIELDGHSVEALHGGLNEVAEFRGKPKVIIANTVKGNGVPGLADKDLCHVMGIHADTINELVGS